MKEQILSEPVKAKLNSLIGEELKAMYTYVYAANWCQNAVDTSFSNPGAPPLSLAISNI